MEIHTKSLIKFPFQLEFSDWRAITARPPSLIGKLDVYGPLQEHLEQLRICLNKITKLSELAKSDRNVSYNVKTLVR